MRPAYPGDEGGVWAVNSFEEEPEKALIIYGTVKDVHANGEAARKLQRAIAARWSNVTVPIKADIEATEDDWKGHHVLLVGSARRQRRCHPSLEEPAVAFGPASFTVKGETYAHSGNAPSSSRARIRSIRGSRSFFSPASAPSQRGIASSTSAIEKEAMPRPY